MKIVTLNDVTEFVLDGTHGSPVRVDSGIPVLSAQNVKNGILNFDTNRFTTKKEYQAFKSRVNLMSGDVLLTIVGTIGRAAVVTEVKPIVFQRSVSIIRPKSHILDSQFLFYVTQTPEFQEQLRRSSNQSSQAGVYLGKLKKVEIPLPPLGEQRRIAAVLGRADALRAQRRAALAKLDTLLQSTFLHLFGDPVTNPMGWEVKTLDMVCEKVTDGTHHSPPIVEQGIPYITAKHIKNGKIDFFANPWFISPEDHQAIYKRCDPKKGDVLYIKDGATTGIAAVNEYDFEFSMLSSLALLRPNSSICTPFYLREWLNNTSVKSLMLQSMGGAAIQRLTLTKIKQKQILLPPLQLQHRFAQQITQIEKLKVAHIAALTHHDTLFHSLQQRAFAGQL